MHVDSVHSDMSHMGTHSRSVSRTHLPIILNIPDNQQTAKKVSPFKPLLMLSIFNYSHDD